MKSKILVAAALAATATLGLVACSGGADTPATEPSASDTTPFHYLYIGGITGAQATLAVQEIAALEVAIDGVNAEGGINGRKVEMETLDSKSDPTEAVSVLQKYLASHPKPDLVRAGLSSTEALAMMPVTTRAGLATHTASASPLMDDVKAYPYNKQVSAKFARQAEMGRTYIEHKKYKKVTLLAPEDASGDANVASVESVYKGTDIKVEVVRYNGADLDLSVAYQRAIATDPDVIYANCLGAPCARIVAARLSVADGTTIPMFGDASMAGASGGPAASAPAGSTENLKVLIFDGQLERSAEKQPETYVEFAEGMSKADVTLTTNGATVAYDGFRMWAQAFNNIKSTDPAKGIEEINSYEWPAAFFVTYGKAAVDYDDDSAFPKLPDNAFDVVQVSPLNNGLYPSVDVFAPKVK
jgi:ABC-type branched-subunit amino acid transport system substrate-binding protein